jgi:hypothetical protein
MVVKFRSFATDSMPERVEVTKELERRYAAQEAARAAIKAATQQTPKTDDAAQGQS